MIHNYAGVMKTLLTWMLPQVGVHEVLILNWKRLIYYVKFFLCVSLIGLWAFKFLLRTSQKIAKKETHVVKDSLVFLKLSLPGGTNSACTFFLFLSFFRSADNSVIKRTACTCHNYNNNNNNKINNEEFLLAGLKRCTKARWWKERKLSATASSQVM